MKNVTFHCTSAVASMLLLTHVDMSKYAIHFPMIKSNRDTYASLHNLTHCYSTFMPSEIVPHYARYFIIKEIFTKTDAEYILYADFDAYITNMRFRLKQFTNYDMVIDGKVQQLFGGDFFNNGIFFVRRGVTIYNFLHDITHEHMFNKSAMDVVAFNKALKHTNAKVLKSNKIETIWFEYEPSTFFVHFNCLAPPFKLKAIELFNSTNSHDERHCGLRKIAQSHLKCKGCRLNNLLCSRHLQHFIKEHQCNRDT